MEQWQLMHFQGENGELPDEIINGEVRGERGAVIRVARAASAGIA